MYTCDGVFGIFHSWHLMTIVVYTLLLLDSIIIIIIGIFQCVLTVK